MRYRKILLAALALCVTLLLSGCRVRTGSGGREIALPDSAAGQTHGAGPGENTSDESEEGVAGDNGQSTEEEIGDPGDQTKENPDSPRKEYDENASAEIVPGTERLLQEEGEGEGFSGTGGEAAQQANQLNDLAEKTAVQTIAATEAEKTSVSEDADAAESAMTYFSVLLQDRTGSAYECQRQNVYWETAQGHVTIHKTAPEHSLILNAGCYDVSARLLPENLRVEDGWVVRKNPGVVVKIVDSSVLGRGVHSPGAAKAVEESLRKRDGWADLDAMKNGRVLLLSREMLEAPYLQTAAMVLIAKTANPALFADVDPDEMLQMLTEEATGALPTGMYYYRKEEWT